MEKIYHTPRFQASEKTLFSAKTYLINRFCPELEKIVLPSYEVPAGKITLSYDGNTSISRAKHGPALRTLLGRLKSGFKPHQVDGRVLIDYRRNAPSNWSHCLNFHIPFAFFLQKELASIFVKSAPLFVLSERIPSYTKNIFTYFGIEYITCDNDVEGTFVEYTQEPFDSLRSWAYLWIQEIIANTEAYKALLNDSSGIPEKIYFSRKGTRSLVNEEEIHGYLSKRGYTRVYAEEHSVVDQLRMYIPANDIAAIHGAAMGPLVFRPPSFQKLNLLEIFTPGHMTGFYHGTADQVGANWVGVRGRIEKKHVQKAYDFDSNYTAHSLDSFFVDIESIESGLNLLDSRMN